MAWLNVVAFDKNWEVELRDGWASAHDKYDAETGAPTITKDNFASRCKSWLSAMRGEDSKASAK